MEAETFKLEHQTCIAETDILKNDFGLHKHESEIKIKELTLENKNCTRQITHLNEKLIKFEGGKFPGNAEFGVIDGFEEWKLQYENTVKERNECEEKLKIFEATQNSFMSFYYRLENYLLMSDCEKAIAEITMFKQKINNQTTTLNDINLHENDVILKNSGMAKSENSPMAQYGRNKTYETLNKIKEEISILQKELCDYRQNNSLLLQHILERNDEMKKFKDSEAICKSLVISLNEKMAQLLQTLEEKEIEVRGLKEKVDFVIPFENQNRTLTAQIESLAQIKSDEDIINKCEGLQSYLKDILVMLKKNKEKCEEKFLDKIDENHIIEKRADLTFMSKKNVHIRQNK
uniref:Uncharacterized protein n=1 Tax=Panagrolaimus davidi TaxID=227884 RepID=A0A914P5V6_9BILA